eukprot:448501-Amphidinium_carterae.1
MFVLSCPFSWSLLQCSLFPVEKRKQELTQLPTESIDLPRVQITLPKCVSTATTVKSIAEAKKRGEWVVVVQVAGGAWRRPGAHSG